MPAPQIKLALPSLPGRARSVARGRAAAAVGVDWELPHKPEVRQRVGDPHLGNLAGTKTQSPLETAFLLL